MGFLEKIEKIEYELNELGVASIAHEDHKLQGDIIPNKKIDPITPCSAKNSK